MASLHHPLGFLIHHIFLPPIPKTNADECYSASGEQELLRTVHDALETFRTNLEAAQTPALDRCIRMLGTMREVQAATSQPVDVFGKQMLRLEEDGMAVFRT